MAHVALNDTQIDAGFEQMGGVAMAQRVDRDAFFAHAGLALGTLESALDTAFGHGTLGIFCAFAVSAKSWEEKMGMTVSAPVLAQQMKRGLRQRDVAVLGAFAAVDMDHHALTVDIADFEMEAFVKPQAAGVHGGQIDVIVQRFDVGQNTAGFFDA